MPAIPLSAVKDKAAVVFVVVRHGMNQVETIGEIVVCVNHFAITSADTVAQSLGKRTALLEICADAMKCAGGMGEVELDPAFILSLIGEEYTAICVQHQPLQFIQGNICILSESLKLPSVTLAHPVEVQRNNAIIFRSTEKRAAIHLKVLV